MNQVTILNPPRLVFGEHALEKFVQDMAQTSYKRLFIISIPPVIATIAPTLDALAKNGVVIALNNSIAGEPSFADFENILAEARSFDADSVVGIGGGSVLDTAKLVAAQIKNSQATNDIKGIGNLKERKTYMACIPTTSGTGSEMSPNAIFIDETGNKVGVISPYLVPDATYIDPALTLSVPPSVTAATGIDALAHCLEAYANNFAHPVVDLIALEGIRLIAANLEKACIEGKNLEARTNVALGSMYGGMCLGPVNTAAVHALAYPLGVAFHVSHGLSVALLLPHVMQFNLDAAPGRYAQIALALGASKQEDPMETSREGIRKLQALMKACGMPVSLHALNIPEEAIPSMATDAMKVQRLLKNNLKPIMQADAELIYKAAFESV